MPPSSASLLLAGACLLSTSAADAATVELVSRLPPDQVSATAWGASHVPAAGRGVSGDGRYWVFASQAPNLIVGQVDAARTDDVFLYDRNAGQITLVSHAGTSSTTAGNSASGSPAISDDGRYVAYLSRASDLGTGPPGSVPWAAAQVVLWDRVAGTTRLVSHSTADAAVPGNGAASELRFSNSGTWLAFTSAATDLTSGTNDTNGASDVFVHEVATAATTLVSQIAGAPGVAGDGASLAGVVSDDGRFVAFVSGASNLVPGQVDVSGTFSTNDIFLADRTAGTQTLVSRVSGSAATAATASPGTVAPLALSADGRFLAFQSYASDLVAGQNDISHELDVFLYDRVAGTSALVSHSFASATTDGTDASTLAALSPDGHFVLLSSRATNLVAGFTDPSSGSGFVNPNLYLVDRGAGTTVLVSHAPGSTTMGGDSATGDRVALADDGGRVLFTSTARNLVAGPLAGLAVYRFDRASDTVTRVSTRFGDPATGLAASELTLSRDGRHTLVGSGAAGLGPELDTNAAADLFLYDLAAATVRTVTQAADPNRARGAQLGALRHRGASVSAEGRYIATRRPLPGPFSRFDPVVEGIWYDRLSGERGAAGASGSGAFFPHLSADGRFIAYDGYANSITSVPFTWSSILDRGTGVDTTVALGGFFGPGIEMSPGGRFATYTGVGELRQIDRLTGSGAWFDIAPGGGEPALAADGHVVAFSSSVGGLDPGAVDTNGASDVFLWDRNTGETTLLSRRAGTASAAGRASGAPELGWGGGRVTFLSEAGDLVAGQVDTGSRQLFAHDRASGITVLVSRSAASSLVPVDAPVEDAVLSPDGKLVAWVSAATNAVVGQSGPAVSQVFLTNLVTGETVLASRSAAASGQGGDGASSQPSLNGDGHYLTFASTATNLVDGQSDSAGTADVFLYDRQTGTTVLASRRAGSTTATANAPSTLPEVSLDGTTVVFNSLASDLAMGDHNADSDVYAFRRDTSPGAFFTVTPCRLLDTREGGQGPALASGAAVAWPVHGRCAVPSTAQAVSLNVTVVPSHDGWLALFPGDLATPPEISTINFRGSQVKANNAVVALSRNGDGTLVARAAVGGGGAVHVVIDVNGYFE